MQTSFDADIQQALGAEMTTPAQVQVTGAAELPSCFAVTDLAVASVRAAAVELGAYVGAQQVEIDRRLAAMWFDMTLRPTGWEMPSIWDPIAGAYRTADGWIRLHTNAPHHRDAALRVLHCAAEKAEVTRAVEGWDKAALEAAVVGEGGAAAAMMTRAEWATHPQGLAVAQEPLIAWENVGEGPAAAPELGAVRILDLTRVLAGPVATRFLAGFGAQVLRIDPPWWSEPGVEPEVTLGKRRAGLDLRRSEDRAVFDDLLSQADVLVHGYRPGALAGLGYDRDALRKHAPGLIDVSLCAYGWSGPWAARRGFDSLVQMSCGIAAEGMQQRGVDHPVPLPVQALDHATGYLIAAAVMRALRVKAATGAVMSARLSLARTAAMLMAQGARAFEGEELQETEEDLAATVEETGWGAARRLAFPVRLDGKDPFWRYPAGPLRRDAPRW